MPENLLMWNAIVAAGLPMLLAILQQPTFPRWARATITLVASIIGGLATTYFSGQWNPEDVVTSVLTIFAATLAFHTAFFKPTGITDAIENATSSSSLPPPVSGPGDPPRVNPGAHGA